MEEHCHLSFVVFPLKNLAIPAFYHEGERRQFNAEWQNTIRGCVQWGSGLRETKLEGFSVTDHINIRAQKGISFAFAFSSTTCSRGGVQKGDAFPANGFLLFPSSAWGIGNTVMKTQKPIWKRVALRELLRNSRFVSVPSVARKCAGLLCFSRPSAIFADGLPF